MNATAQLTAVATNSDASTVTWPAFTWGSSDSGVATVTGSGLVTATANGSALVHASLGGFSDTVMVTVSQEAAAVTVLPSSLAFWALGDSAQLSADVVDANGFEVVGAAGTWMSSSPTVATVSSSGWVSALAEGSAWVSHTSSTVTAGADISVALPPPPRGISIDFETQADGSPVCGGLNTWCDSTNEYQAWFATFAFTRNLGGADQATIDGTIGSRFLTNGRDGSGQFAPIWAGALNLYFSVDLGSVAFDLVYPGAQPAIKALDTVGSELQSAVVDRTVTDLGGGWSSEQVIVTSGIALRVITVGPGGGLLRLDNLAY